MYNPLDLTGKLILVTGASSGIGQSTAICLSKLGASVVLTGRRQEALEHTLDQMPVNEHHIEPFDLTQVDEISRWLKDMVSRCGRPLDGIVHSAGIFKLSPLKVTTAKAFEELMQVNLYSATQILRGASNKAMLNDGGSVVLLSSVAGMVASPALSAYATSKHALQALAKSAAKELKTRHIRVNAVAPGWVDTPMHDQMGQTLSGDEITERQFLGLIPPEEVAVSIAYLLSDMAKHVTGSTLLVDGGYLC